MVKTASLKLLVVDDHAAFRSTVRQLFEDCAVVTEAGSGEEAVRLYAAERSDWIIMDLRMAGMGGLKATEAIRRLDPQARVIVISQFTEPELAERARTMGGEVSFQSRPGAGTRVGLDVPLK